MNRSNNSVAPLAAELFEKVVSPLPVVDVHTHINPADPGAHDVGEIIFYHYILSELVAAGVSRKKLDCAKTPEERADLFLASYQHLANTVTFWCLRRVLETYGLGIDAELTREALLEVDRKVRATHSDSSWPRKILLEKNRILKAALTLNITENIPPSDANIFFSTLRLDDALSTATERTIREFAEVSGKNIDSLASFERAAGERVTNFEKHGGRALSLGLAPREDFVSVERPAAEKTFDRVLRGESISLREEASLHRRREIPMAERRLLLLQACAVGG